jgi:CDGSH-type Zn-finger protein
VPESGTGRALSRWRTLSGGPGVPGTWSRASRRDTLAALSHGQGKSGKREEYEAAKGDVGMARLVRHDRNEPFAVKKDEVDEDTLWLCACGLSKDKPFCDGSHKRTKDEEAGAVYMYDDRDRIKIKSMY